MHKDQFAGEPFDDDPVSMWIEELKNSDDSAVEKLWNHFVSRLYEAARKKLRSTTRPLYDEEDAAQSAFHSVCAGIAAGRFPNLHARENLWRLMLVITSRKIARRHKYDLRQRRDVRRNVSNLVFSNLDDESQIGGVEDLPSREPTPEFAAEFVETCESLSRNLADPQLQQVMALKMEGRSNAEIADRLSCAQRTVRRCLEIIRRQWHRQELAGEV